MTTIVRNTQGQIVSAKGLRRAARRKAIAEAAKKFKPGSLAKLSTKKDK